MKRNRHVVVLAFVLAGVLFSAPSPSRADTPCDSIQKQLDGLKELRKETVADLHQPGLSAAEKSRLNQQLKQVGQQIAGDQLLQSKPQLRHIEPSLGRPTGERLVLRSSECKDVSEGRAKRMGAGPRSWGGL